MWWAQMESNHRPHAYQACALTIWAMSPYCLEFFLLKVVYIFFWKYIFKTSLFLLRKEVIQPHLLIRLPCYDFTPIISSTFDCCLLESWLTGFGYPQLSWCDGRCVQGPGTYSRQYAALPLLAIPASWRRISAFNPNWDCFFKFCFTSLCCFSLLQPL